MTERLGPSLEQLQAKVAQFDAALSKVQKTSNNLGGGNGSIRLNYSLANLSELDLSTRITEVVGIRKQIITRTTPKLEQDRAELVSQIENHTESRLRANIEFVRSLIGQGATEKELELAEQALKNYKARTAGLPPTAPTPPVETTPSKEPEKPGEKEEIILDPEKKSVVFKDQTIPLSDMEFTMLNHVADLKHTDDDRTTNKVFEALQEAGSKSTPAIVSAIASNLERKLGRKVFDRRKQDPLTWIWSIDDRFEVKKVVLPTPDEGKSKRHQESRQLFEITLDGRQIKVQGRLTALSLQTLADTSPENRIRLTDLAKHLYGKDDREATAKARDLMTMNNKRAFAKLNLQVVIDGIKDQATVYLQKLAQEGEQPGETVAHIDKLQKELADLYQFRTEIQEQVAQGIWPQNDLDELNAEITQKEAQIRLLKPLGPEDMTERSEVRFIPYEPSPDEIRTGEENKILEYIISAISANSLIRFEDIQAKLGPRIGSIPGGKGIIIYQAKELKDMFQAGLGKFREEAEIPNDRARWNENDRILWDKIEQAITKLSSGDVADFVRKVNTLIDKSEREFYRNSPPPENGGRKVQYIKLP